MYISTRWKFHFIIRNTPRYIFFYIEIKKYVVINKVKNLKNDYDKKNLKLILNDFKIKHGH